VKGWLSRAMVDAMAPLIDPVPVEVEAMVGRTWAGNVRSEASAAAVGHVA